MIRIRKDYFNTVNKKGPLWLADLQTKLKN
jgi:hypothetical protein